MRHLLQLIESKIERPQNNCNSRVGKGAADHTSLLVSVHDLHLVEMFRRRGEDGGEAEEGELHDVDLAGTTIDVAATATAAAVCCCR